MTENLCVILVCTLVFPSVSGNIRVQAEQFNPQELLNDC
jgi:hypothetical protein